VLDEFLKGFLLFAAALAVLLYSMYRRHMRQFENLDLRGVRFYLNMLLERGRDGAFAIFEDQRTTRFVQFRWVARGLEKPTIVCDFPDAPWSKPYYAALHVLLNEKGTPFEEVTGSARPTFLFTRVCFGQDVDQAAEFVEAVFTKLFGQTRLAVRGRSDGIEMPKAASDGSGRDQAHG
jgi:hypothetical protein